jgi:hypothetical protein
MITLESATQAQSDYIWLSSAPLIVTVEKNYSDIARQSWGRAHWRESFWRHTT